MAKICVISDNKDLSLILIFFCILCLDTKRVTHTNELLHNAQFFPHNLNCNTQIQLVTIDTYNIKYMEGKFHLPENGDLEDVHFGQCNFALLQNTISMRQEMTDLQHQMFGCHSNTLTYTLEFSGCVQTCSASLRSDFLHRHKNTGQLCSIYLMVVSFCRSSNISYPNHFQGLTML